MIKAVFFDFGDTLVDEHTFLSEGWHNMIDFLITCLQLEKSRTYWLSIYRSYHAEIYKKYFHEMPIIKEKKIKMESIKNLIRAMGEPENTELIDQAYSHLIRGSGYSNCLFEGAQHLLEQLSERYKLAIVSNGLADYTIISLEYLGIAKYFSPILISEQSNCEKPGTEIFKLALDQTGVGPEEAVMVGNLLDYDILGANLSGIRSVWLQHSPQMIGTTIPDYTIHHLKELSSVMEKLQ